MQRSPPTPVHSMTVTMFSFNQEFSNLYVTIPNEEIRALKSYHLASGPTKIITLQFKDKAMNVIATALLCGSFDVRL